MEGTAKRPSIGRIVIYRSRTGDYDCPAIITGTVDTLNPRGVEAGRIAALDSELHVHLTVFTPGFPNLREAAEDFKAPLDPANPISENLSGCYQEWNVRLDGFQPGGEDEHDPGSWRWPDIVRPGSAPRITGSPITGSPSSVDGPPDPDNDSGASG